MAVLTLNIHDVQDAETQIAMEILVNFIVVYRNAESSHVRILIIPIPCCYKLIVVC